MTTAELILSGSHHDVWPFPAPVALHDSTRPVRMGHSVNGIEAMRDDQLEAAIVAARGVGLDAIADELNEELCNRDDADLGMSNEDIAIDADWDDYADYMSQQDAICDSEDIYGGWLDGVQEYE